MTRKQPYPMISEMHPHGRPYTPGTEMVAVAMAHSVADEEVVKEIESSSTNAHTAKWTITPPMHLERERTLKVIQIPPAMTSRHATTAVSQDTSRLTAST
jgi:hypothetical protein